jgi:hypothetical protein
MISRRGFLKLGTAGAGMFLFTKFGFTRRGFPAIPGGTLDPTTIDKYVTQLVIPPVMPPVTAIQNTLYRTIPSTMTSSLSSSSSSRSRLRASR